MLTAFALLVLCMFAMPSPIKASTANASTEPERFEFQAEVSRLMDIIVNSLYTKKEIFLRELISNASDALDKFRFISLTMSTSDSSSSGAETEIRISGDESAQTLTIRDFGVGMTRQDLVDNLGTVARSGTTQFVEAMAAGQQSENLIGQFGVGFYSAYLVADRIRVRSKFHNSTEQFVWESTADATFTVGPDETGEGDLERGTEITLYLKEDALEFAKQATLETLIKRHSEFIQFPIKLKKEKVSFVDAQESDDDSDDSDDDAEDATPPEQERVVTIEWEVMNDRPALWTRSKDDVSRDEYVEFYRLIAKDTYGEPMEWSHFRAEGEIEFKSLLYIPKTAPKTMYDDYYGKSASLKLYVRRVLITDSFEDLVPRYLNFVKGVVDSDDLPLVVSREQLQQDKILKVMGKKIVRKTLEMIQNMADDEKLTREDYDDELEDEDEDEEDEDVLTYEERTLRYSKFWKQFGKSMKLGVIEDGANRKRIVELLRFRSTFHSMEDADDNYPAMTSLSDYFDRMPEWQTSLYYLAGETEKRVRDSPFLEKALAKGIEVMLMTDPLDEYVLQNLPDFQGREIVSLSKENVRFGDEDEEFEARATEFYERKFEPLVDFLKDALKERVSQIRLTTHRSSQNAPAVVVTSQFGYSATMERIMKSQTMGTGDGASAGHMTAKRILELNPLHPIVNSLLEDVENYEAKKATDLGWLLYDAALVNSGFEMEDTKEFAARMYRLMKVGLNLSSLDLLEEDQDIPEKMTPLDQQEDDDEFTEEL